MQSRHPIGIFDSGFGGLTVFSDIKKKMPQYDYVYLGDNARAPYGDRSHQTVYEYTLQAVRYLFGIGCPIVILACNTASARALRRIQQEDLHHMAPGKKVLGIIYPSAEIIGEYTRSNVIGILGTRGTVSSGSYKVEIAKHYPDLVVHQHACPLWVSLVENYEHESDNADYYVKKDLDALLSMSPDIDLILLACTHYPLLIGKIKKYIPAHVNVIAQGSIVADSFADYLLRHPEVTSAISQQGDVRYYTTDNTEDFDAHASMFLGYDVQSELVRL